MTASTTFGGDARPSFAADENVEGLIGDDGAAAADLLPGLATAGGADRVRLPPPGPAAGG